MKQRIAVDGGNHGDVAAVSAVAAAGAAARDELLPPEGEAAVTAIARLDGDDYFIYEQRLTDWLKLFNRFDADELAHLATVFEFDHAGDFGEERIVFAPADIDAGLDGCAALAHDDGTTGDELSAEDLHTEPLRVGVAPVFGTA
jgi:hypothetical protein